METLRAGVVRLAIIIALAGCAAPITRFRVEWYSVWDGSEKKVVLALVNVNPEAVVVDRIVVNEGAGAREWKISPARTIENSELVLVPFDVFVGGKCLLPYKVALSGPAGFRATVDISPLPFSLPEEFVKKCKWTLQ